MSTYRRDMEVVLDGAAFKIKTGGQDMANAERMAARDGFNIAAGGAVATQQRLAYIAFRRANPQHPCALAFGDFIEHLDDITDLETIDAEALDELDPTRPEDTGEPL
jgi:hypothetical protein